MTTTGSHSEQVDHTLKPASIPAHVHWFKQLYVFFLIGLLACGGQPNPSTHTPQTTLTFTPTRQTTVRVPNPTPTPSPQPTSTLGIDPEELNGIIIRLWHPWDGASAEAVQGSISEFNATNPYGVQAEAIYVGNYDAMNERIQAASPAELPHVAVGYAYQIQDWQASGVAITDLNTYLNDPEWGLTPDELTDFFPAIMAQDQIDRLRLGFPAQRFAQVMIYNKTWAEQLGFSSLPSTPKAFQEQTCAAAQANKDDSEPSNDVTGGWLINTSPSAMLSWFYSFGGQVLVGGNGGYRFQTPEIESAVEYLKSLFDAGCAWESSGTDPIVELAERRALLITTSLADLPFIQTAFDKVGNKDDWSALPFPTPKSEPVLVVYGPAFTILQNTPEEELAAWLLIKWLVAPEQHARLVSSSSSLILRGATLESLVEYSAENPQWAAIQTYLSHARPEPTLRSWGTVRWVLADVGTQLFRYYFTPERIPATLELMDETAAELHDRIEEEIPQP